MPTRDYWIRFGADSPSAVSGLSPTFIRFVNGSGATILPPGITETYSGSGMYRFAYDATQTISFVADAATTGLANSVRYVYGVVDPLDNMTPYFNGLSTSVLNLGTSLNALGVSVSAIGVTQLAHGVTLSGIGITLSGVGITLTGVGNTLSGLAASFIAFGATLGDLSERIGFTSSSYGSTSVDPSTVFGYLKRAQEYWEGDSGYLKSSGVWQSYSRGSSTLLRVKTISDGSAGVTKI